MSKTPTDRLPVSPPNVMVGESGGKRKSSMTMADLYQKHLAARKIHGHGLRSRPLQWQPELCRSEDRKGDAQQLLHGLVSRPSLGERHSTGDGPCCQLGHLRRCPVFQSAALSRSGTGIGDAGQAFTGQHHPYPIRQCPRRGPRGSTGSAIGERCHGQHKVATSAQSSGWDGDPFPRRGWRLVAQC